MASKKQSAPAPLVAALAIIVALLIIMLILLLIPDSNTETTASDKSGTIPLGSGSLDKASNIQGGSNFSPQQAAPIKPQELESVNLK